MNTLQLSVSLLFLMLAVPVCEATRSNITTWHAVWVGGQSNSVGTNSQKPGEYPAWEPNPRIQMFCWGKGCAKNGTFAQASVPVFGENNVGFSLTYANLLLQSLPEDEGVVLVNTGVGGTGFHLKEWCPTCPLAIQSVNVMKQLYAALPGELGGAYKLHSTLWHQGESDAGDNAGFTKDGTAVKGKVAHGSLAGPPFHADYCTYLMQDLSPLIDFFRVSFPGATNSTPFIDGGLLPYWEDIQPGTQGVQGAIYALNSSRACTATADSRIFADYTPTGLPNGDPLYRSGVSGDVIHFTALQATVMGSQYWEALGRALALKAVQPSAQTVACGSSIQAPVAACG